MQRWRSGAGENAVLVVFEVTRELQSGGQWEKSGSVENEGFVVFVILLELW